MMKKDFFPSFKSLLQLRQNTINRLTSAKRIAFN